MTIPIESNAKHRRGFIRGLCSNFVCFGLVSNLIFRNQVLKAFIFFSVIRHKAFIFIYRFLTNSRIIAITAFGYFLAAVGWGTGLFHVEISIEKPNSK